MQDGGAGDKGAPKAQVKIFQNARHLVRPQHFALSPVTATEAQTRATSGQKILGQLPNFLVSSLELEPASRGETPTLGSAVAVRPAFLLSGKDQLERPT